MGKGVGDDVADDDAAAGAGTPCGRVLVRETGRGAVGAVEARSDLQQWVHGLISSYCVLAAIERFTHRIEKYNNRLNSIE
jgi:hypothetical protein